MASPITPPRSRRNDTGATLALVLAYILVVGLVIGAMGAWIRNDLNNAVHFANARKTQYALNGAMNVAIENIRYNPLVGSGQTLNASPPSYCWGSSAPSTVSTIDGISENVWCSTVWNPASIVTRVVTLSACPVALTAAQCAANPSLQAVVNFDDYPQVGYTLVNTLCTTTCGDEMLLDSWIYSGTLSNALGITVSSPPQSVSAVYSATSSALVNWTTPLSNGGSAITSYTAVATDVTNNIYSGQSCTTAGTSCTITNLNPGDTYTVVMYATNSMGNSNGSSPVTVTTTVPTAPTSVNATAGDAQATVGWAAPASDGGSAITGYTVTSSAGQTCTTASTNCTVTSLTNGITYTFTVTAINAVGTSSASSPSNAVTPIAPVTVNFTYTGGAQTWTVPSGVTSISVTAYGASGGNGSYGGGLGGEVNGTLAVTPGEVLTIIVAGAGTNDPANGGFGGGGAGGTYNTTSEGGGGGASQVENGSAELAIAGGGGGGSYNGAGGAGGGTNGVTATGSYGGGGGTQNSGGATGGGSLSGGAAATGSGGGGGGGGYFGGGGGNGFGGGGGSSLVPNGGTTSAGVNFGNGSVSITY